MLHFFIDLDLRLQMRGSKMQCKGIRDKGLECRVKGFRVRVHGLG